MEGISVGPLSLFRMSVIETLRGIEAPREGNPLWERAELMLVFHLEHEELAGWVERGFDGWVPHVWQFFATLSDEQQRAFQEWLDDEESALKERKVEAV